MKGLESTLLAAIEAHKPLDYPGGQIQAYSKGKKIVDLPYGKTWKFYDLASLTKVIFTTSLLMNMQDEKYFQTKAKVKRFLPWFPRSSVTLKNLLNHSAGHIWWSDFYRNISQTASRSERLNQLLRLIRKQKISRQKKAKYSDVDFLLLGAVLENLLDKPLDWIWTDFHEKWLGSSELHFNTNNNPKFAKSKYAPTEKCVWRKKILQGEVHDENCWALGGVGPHAGLFGTIGDVSQWGLEIRNSYFDLKKTFVKSATIRLWAKQSLSVQRGNWGLGFMKPSVNSTAGKYFSKDSFGHTGFTGTSFWFDPKRDLFITLVSNRVHPSRTNRDFILLRPKIHDLIVEHLERKSN